ncbi:MAG: FAD-dependent monooxygenase [Smithella sp.]|nr:FAD-dependent monooxygenase [Smithella sp.]MDM7986831.1 FAD-dependent monooxygenase [Smithella sp.]HQG65463.1 FAD-dependent monooxygenase [Smithella sp.]HQH16419.1 FAD-dependent monooxygenase [Smithella sp.]HQI72872.1 FAD-dependent monooxygenase [Smithella sp.]
MDSYNVLIIGSGPAGLFAAIELERLGVDRIAIVDRNPYPAGGLLNDGKLNFDYRIGIDLDELKINSDMAQNLMRDIRQIFICFPKCKQVTFIDRDEQIEALREITAENGAQFIAPEQWHWGTDNGKAAVDYLRKHLKKTKFLLGTTINSIASLHDDSFQILGSCRKKNVHYTAKIVLTAPGRSGAYWFRDLATKLNIRHNFGPIDVGIRVELNRKFYDDVTNIVYDPKFIFCTTRHKDKVRTFCTNPGGRVRPEDYYDFKLVNGDALSGRKTANTNFALINTVALTAPFSDTTEFGQMIARQFFLLGGGKPIVQRVGDFREGRRSSHSTFNSRSRHFEVCKATYHATPGDITLGLPARIIDNLWESLKKIDKIVPGILHPSTLLYAPEIKFFDTHFITDNNLETNVKGIFVAGDGAGKSRGIVGAGISGIIAARGITRKYF